MAAPPRTLEADLQAEVADVLAMLLLFAAPATRVDVDEAPRAASGWSYRAAEPRAVTRPASAPARRHSVIVT